SNPHFTQVGLQHKQQYNGHQAADHGYTALLGWQPDTMGSRRPFLASITLAGSGAFEVRRWAF
ncbi:MAG: hypothetical protein K8R19_03215, partial [Methanosarcinales archaeon]|nr:hypothetical protein [Methanosarcinales archaeon]